MSPLRDAKVTPSETDLHVLSVRYTGPLNDQLSLFFTLLYMPFESFEPDGRPLRSPDGFWYAQFLSVMRLNVLGGSIAIETGLWGQMFIRRPSATPPNSLLARSCR